MSFYLFFQADGLDHIYTGAAISHQHPLHHGRGVIWYGPSQIENHKDIHHTFERYGNVGFCLKSLSAQFCSEGRIQEKWKFYFIEVIEYESQTACRVLVTQIDYPQLRQFNPMEIGSPLYFDEESCIFYHIKRSLT